MNLVSMTRFILFHAKHAAAAMLRPATSAGASWSCRHHDFASSATRKQCRGWIVEDNAKFCRKWDPSAQCKCEASTATAACVEAVSAAARQAHNPMMSQRGNGSSAQRSAQAAGNTTMLINSKASNCLEENNRSQNLNRERAMASSRLLASALNSSALMQNASEGTATGIASDQRFKSMKEEEQGEAGDADFNDLPIWAPGVNQAMPEGFRPSPIAICRRRRLKKFRQINATRGHLRGREWASRWR